jgi:phage-related baseplate assembly protein
MSSAIQLDRLPPPDVVEPLNFETLLAQGKALFSALWDSQRRTDPSLPAIDLDRESEPVVKQLQLVAYIALGLRQRVNDAARANLLPTAKGADLDNLGAFFGVKRLVLREARPELDIAAVLESDEDYRERITLAPASFSVAGPEAAYVFHARSASGDVVDASAISPQPDDIRQVVQRVLAAHGAPPALLTDMAQALDAARWPGEVIVSVLARQGDGQATPALLDAVTARVNEDGIRPLTDFVTVTSAQIVRFTVRATLWSYAGPDPVIAMAAARRQLDTYLADARRLGRSITLSGLYAALHVAGIQKVDLHEPVANLVMTATQAAYCAPEDIALSYGGIGA